MGSNGDITPEQAFGVSLRRERERRKWRQEDVAALMAKHGLDRNPSFYSKIETGTTRLKLNEAASIAGALGIPLTQMITTASRRDMEAELEQAQATAVTAYEESESALYRALAARNRQRELIIMLTDTDGGKS